MCDCGSLPVSLDLPCIARTLHRLLSIHSTSRLAALPTSQVWAVAIEDLHLACRTVPGRRRDLLRGGCNGMLQKIGMGRNQRQDLDSWTLQRFLDIRSESPNHGAWKAYGNQERLPYQSNRCPSLHVPTWLRILHSDIQGPRSLPFSSSRSVRKARQAFVRLPANPSPVHVSQTWELGSRPVIPLASSGLSIHLEQPSSSQFEPRGRRRLHFPTGHFPLDDFLETASPQSSPF